MPDLNHYIAAHPDADRLRCLADGTLPVEETIALLTHCEDCPACMDAYIATVSVPPFEEPSPAFEQRLIAAVQTEAARRQPRIVVWWNVVKLAAAVSLTVLLLVTGVFDWIGRSSENLLDYLSLRTAQSTLQPPAPPKEQENHWKKLTDGFQSGFDAVVDQIQSFFTGDERDE